MRAVLMKIKTRGIWKVKQGACKPEKVGLTIIEYNYKNNCNCSAYFRI